MAVEATGCPRSLLKIRPSAAEYATALSRPIPIKAVRDAIALLIRTGLVEKRHGGETFVSEKIDPARDQSTSDSQGDEVTDYLGTVIGTNRELETTTLGIEIDSADAAPELELHEGGMVISRHEQHSIDGKLYSIRTSFYPMELAALGAAHLLEPNAIPDDAPTYIRATLGINQVGCRETYRVRVADSAEAMSFGFSAKSSGHVIEVRRIAYDEVKRPIWLTVTVYAADRNQIVFEEGQMSRVAPMEAYAKPGC